MSVMGLDITAYRKLTPAPDAKRNHCGDSHVDISENIIAWTEKEWPGRTDGVKAGTYTFAESFRFRAGSYGGYNAWRSWLARVAGWLDAADCWNATDPNSKPFAELINFADNEGVIGPKVAAKLAKDFADNESKAVARADETGWEINRYREWRKAFEMAADHGAVEFH